MRIFIISLLAAIIITSFVACSEGGKPTGNEKISPGGSYTFEEWINR